MKSSKIWTIIMKLFRYAGIRPSRHRSSLAVIDKEKFFKCLLCMRLYIAIDSKNSVIGYMFVALNRFQMHLVLNVAMLYTYTIFFALTVLLYYFPFIALSIDIGPTSVPSIHKLSRPAPAKRLLITAIKIHKGWNDYFIGLWIFLILDYEGPWEPQVPSKRLHCLKLYQPQCSLEIPPWP